MKVSFSKLKIGVAYSRHELAKAWGYRGYQALARGLVTPAGHNKLILFITEGNRRQQTRQKYSNHLDGRNLEIEGPEDHFAEERMLHAATSGDEIHLFYRDNPREDFTYRGQVHLTGSQLHATRPSEFRFRLN